MTVSSLSDNRFAISLLLIPVVTVVTISSSRAVRPNRRSMASNICVRKVSTSPATPSRPIQYCPAITRRIAFISSCDAESFMTTPRAPS